MMLRPDDEHPIAALASGSGFGAVGIIRLSGFDCWRVVSPCLIDPSEPKERQATLRQLRDPATSETVDNLLLLYFKGPRSFTGQDTVELFCHGGPYIIQRILGLLYAHGARPANPGEFSKRALLNGKIDLTAAEGIKDLVEAQSRQQWLAGQQLYSGRLKNQITNLRQELIGAMAYLEAMIDFPDEGDTQHVGLDQVRQRLTRVNSDISALVSTFQSGRVASRGLMVALAGAPNAGKSTLLNTLLGKPRAIVSDIAGTTRDYIEETCLLEGRLIRLVDTAGIRETEDQIEHAGIKLSLGILKEADVILALHASDSSAAERESLREITSQIKTPVISILTKCDKGSPDWGASMLAISCETGTGILDLRKSLIECVDQHMGHLEERPFLTSQRQQSALLGARASLDRFTSQDQAGAGHEMLAFELLEASRAMSSVIGDISNEDILDKVFSEFCIGK